MLKDYAMCWKALEKQTFLKKKCNSKSVQWKIIKRRNYQLHWTVAVVKISIDPNAVKYVTTFKPQKPFKCTVNVAWESGRGSALVMGCYTDHCCMVKTVKLKQVLHFSLTSDKRRKMLNSR